MKITDLIHDGRQIGYFIDNFLVLFLDDYLPEEKQVQAIIDGANVHGIKVIFNTMVPEYILESKLYMNLLDIAKYSQDDIKTAVVVGSSRPLNLFRPELYSFNQIITVDNKPIVLHAEDTLVEYVKLINMSNDIKKAWQMILEPCEYCLKGMMLVGATRIKYYDNHKAKWNTPSYLHLVNNIQNKIIYKKASII